MIVHLIDNFSAYSTSYIIIQRDENACGYGNRISDVHGFLKRFCPDLPDTDVKIYYSPVAASDPSHN